MQISKIRYLRRIARCLKNLSLPQGLVLVYHRVAVTDSDTWAMCVTPEHFAEHLEVLRQYGQPVGLQQLVQALRDGKSIRRAVAVTFDDGYADNLYNAKPLLEQYDIPATVFLTTGCLGREREFWWDELDKLLLQPGTLPETLRLMVNGNSYQWQLGEAANYSEEAYRRHRDWNCDVSEKNGPGPRQNLYRALYCLLRPLAEDQRREMMDLLFDWAGIETKARPTHRTLSLDEVHHLADHELIEIGSHTVSHPALPTIPVATQRDEIRRSKAYLEGLLGRRVTSFAYPYGAYTTETVTNVREAGFYCACTVSFDAIWRRTDCFQLPRVTVGNWDRETFARVTQWLV